MKQKTTIYYVTYEVVTKSGNKLDFTQTFDTAAERNAFTLGVYYADNVTVKEKGHID